MIIIILIKYLLWLFLFGNWGSWSLERGRLRNLYDFLNIVWFCNLWVFKVCSDLLYVYFVKWFNSFCKIVLDGIR